MQKKEGRSTGLSEGNRSGWRDIGPQPSQPGSFTDHEDEGDRAAETLVDEDEWDEFLVGPS